MRRQQTHRCWYDGRCLECPKTRRRSGLASGLSGYARYADGDVQWHVSEHGMALGAAAVIFTLWYVNRQAGVMAAILFYLIKAVFVRIAFGLDQGSARADNHDLLGMAPTIVLAVLILSNLFADYSRGKSIAPDKPRKLALALAGVSLVSICFPTNSLLVGLGGFQRNIMPNMLVMFLTASVWDRREFRTGLAKMFLGLGLFSCLYGIGQWLQGIYPWEEAWMMDRLFVQGNHGMMTVGLRGVEFRIFSVFFSYMDFFFTNVIIFGLALAYKSEFSRGWRLLRVLYFILWGAMLLISVERMPIVMTFAVIVAANFLRQSKDQRRRMFKRYLAVGVGMYLLLLAAAPVLTLTGADNLRRLSELSDPLEAQSIQDRSDNIWGPVLASIASHPWGVGIGYGSQTRASDEADATGLRISPHNELLQKTLETGFVGGIIYLLLHISLFKKVMSRKSKDGTLPSLVLAFAAVTVSYWICGLVNVPFSGSSGLLYWSLAGIVLTRAGQAPDPAAGETS